MSQHEGRFLATGRKMFHASAVNPSLWNARAWSMGPSKMSGWRRDMMLATGFRVQSGGRGAWWPVRPEDSVLRRRVAKAGWVREIAG
jgi:hypothetical protein